MNNDAYKEEIKNDIYELIFLGIELMKIPFNDCLNMPINVLKRMIDWKIKVQNKQLEEMNKDSDKTHIKGKKINLR